MLALVPVVSNTRHWKNFVFDKADATAFLYDTRLRFLKQGRDEEKGAPVSCAMIYWGSEYDRFEAVFSKFGAVGNIRHLQGKHIGPSDHLPLFDELKHSSKGRRQPKPHYPPSHHSPTIFPTVSTKRLCTASFGRLGCRTFPLEA